MPLRDVIMKSVTREKKKPRKRSVSTPILFLRSDTHTAEVIHPPSSPTNDASSHSKHRESMSERTTKRLLEKLRPISATFTDLPKSPSKPKPKASAFRGLSRHLHRRKTQTSEKVPINMPDIEIITEQVEKSVEKRINEIRSEWEKRATLLAKANEESQKKLIELEVESATTEIPPNNDMIKKDIKPALCMTAADETGDNIQEAIRLHEAGELENSTLMFGRLAELPGENNNLSRLLYGLSLRHGWGCTQDPAKALRYLSAAASGAALIEDSALKAGKKRGGPAKGELVIAIFELANCFRYGWGLPVDEVAAKQYYETAANLGDTDAMNEVAQCYVDGFGCSKDKFAAARYYRMAEREGSKTLGNSWIWKEKYDLPNKVTFKD